MGIVHGVSMSYMIDISNQRFGKLIAIQRVPSGIGNRTIWLCRCDCGTIKTVQTGNLRNGDTKSCGCASHEAARQRFIQMNTSHGWSGTATYESWKAMNKRCSNKNSPDYPDYGGRGIAVCPQWQKFEAFLADMGPRPEGMTIERNNNQLGYSKSNCKWATPVEQANNKRTNTMITCGGVTKTLTQWCREMGLNYQTIQGRIQDKKWSPERAFTQPIKQTKRTHESYIHRGLRGGR